MFQVSSDGAPGAGECRVSLALEDVDLALDRAVVHLVDVDAAVQAHDLRAARKAANEAFGEVSFLLSLFYGDTEP